MIQVNELRIGNNILLLGEVCTIECISNLPKRKEMYWIKTKEFIDTKIIHFKPIPLTEEILLKCGLQIREITVDGKQQKHYSDFRNIAIEVLSKDYLMLGLHKGHEHIEPIRRVEYLHQLQNLYFALTNEELTFNNL